MQDKTNKGLRAYHYQAGEDQYAKQQGTPAIMQASLKDIKAAYDELMQDLLLEGQEAY